MIWSAYVGVMVLLAAASLGALERCLGPDMRRFPCVNSKTIWVLRIYTLFLVWAAFDRLNSCYIGAPLQTTPGQMGASTAMAFAHTSLLIVVLKLRLNEGVWPRLFARWRRVHDLNKLGGVAGGVLARTAATVDAPIDLPSGVRRETLDQLARMP